MDCQNLRSNFHLVGVFVESDGLKNWMDQVIQHQGSCLWEGAGDEEEGDDDESDDDLVGALETADYQFMQNQEQSWTVDCQQVEHNNTAYYYGLKPLPGGLMTFSLYDDADCSVESDVTLENYLQGAYVAKGHTEASAITMVESKLDVIDRWNDLLDVFKVCQPCKAFKLVANSDNERRLASNDESDGEQYGYNCYDASGTLNANQVSPREKHGIYWSSHLLPSQVLLV